MNNTLSNKTALLLVAFVLVAMSLIGLISAAPNGATVSKLSSSRGNDTSPGNDSAQAGNVTEITLSGDSITQTWQGYYGNVSGVIKLADGSNNVLYNWTALSPSGEVYSSTNNTISWSTIQCFNFTSNGSLTTDTAGETAGNFNLAGMNVTQLENTYNIPVGASDGVNRTFAGRGHVAFNVGSVAFTSNKCQSIRVYDSTGKSTAGNFEEAILYEPSTSSVVFATLLEQDQLGFDQRAHDFEMLVLEDGHGSNVATTPYYFFVELD